MVSRLLSYLIFSIFIAALVSTSCQSNSHSKYAAEFNNWTSQNGKLKVLSTIGMIDDLVRKIGGDNVDALLLIKGELDPHSYQPVKGDDEKFSYAGVIFYNGLGLEHGPAMQRHLQENPWAFGIGNLLKVKYPELILSFRGQDDPHIWMDISLWAKGVPIIVEALSAKDPQHAEYYHANGEALTKAMLSKHEELKILLQKLPDSRRYLVTSHDAFNYFTKAYLANDVEREQNNWTERFAAPEGLAPESQISSKDIQEILDYLNKYQVQTIFFESNVSKNSIRKIMDAGQQKGIDVKIAEKSLFADAMGGEGSGCETYLQMMEHNASSIYHCLEADNKSFKDGGN